METPRSPESVLTVEDSTGQPSKALRWLAGFLFCAAGIASIVLARYKLQALLYHSVDFPYYLDSARLLLQPRAQIAFNPEGINCLGFIGASAVKNLHQSIHLEPVKYGWALMAYLLRSPEFLFVFFAAMYFCPILYFSTHFKPRTWLDTAFGALFVVMYCGLPCVANTVTFDLRPYALLAPACVLAVLAVRLDRPIGERLLFFNLMFFFREEAILLGPIIILYVLVRSSESRADRFRTALSMVISWCAWAAIIALYFRWTQYPNRFSPKGLREFVTEYPAGKMLLASGIACLAIVAFLMFRFRRVIALYRSTLVLTLLLIPAFGMFVNMTRDPILRRNGALNVVYGARWAMLWIVLLLVLLDLWSKPWPPAVRRRGLAFVTGLCVVLISLNFVGTQSVVALLNQCANRIGPARFVWSARDEIPRGANVMADYDTLQAFTDFPQVSVFDRMPISLASGRDRFYPKNKPILTRLLNDGTTYLILSRKNADDLPEILTPEAQEKLTVLGANERYKLLFLKGANQREPQAPVVPSESSRSESQPASTPTASRTGPQ